MSDYIGACRSNYFRVKDPESFRRFIEGLGGVVLTRDLSRLLDLDESDEDYLVYGFYYDEGSILPDLEPIYEFPPEDCDKMGYYPEEEYPLFVDELGKHLAPGEAAVILGYSDSKKERLIETRMWVVTEDKWEVVDLMLLGMGTVFDVLREQQSPVAPFLTHPRN